VLACLAHVFLLGFRYLPKLAFLLRLAVDLLIQASRPFGVGPMTPHLRYGPISDLTVVFGLASALLLALTSSGTFSISRLAIQLRLWKDGLPNLTVWRRTWQNCMPVKSSQPFY
jgi:hypothetical protein